MKRCRLSTLVLIYCGSQVAPVVFDAAKTRIAFKSRAYRSRSLFYPRIALIIAVRNAAIAAAIIVGLVQNFDLVIYCLMYLKKVWSMCSYLFLIKDDHKQVEKRHYTYITMRLGCFNNMYGKKRVWRGLNPHYCILKLSIKKQLIHRTVVKHLKCNLRVRSQKSRLCKLMNSVWTHLKIIEVKRGLRIHTFLTWAPTRPSWDRGKITKENNLNFQCHLLST